MEECEVAKVIITEYSEQSSNYSDVFSDKSFKRNRPGKYAPGSLNLVEQRSATPYPKGYLGLKNLAVLEFIGNPQNYQ